MTGYRTTPDRIARPFAALLLALALALSGCSGGEEPGVEGGSGGDQQPDTVSPRATQEEPTSEESAADPTSGSTSAGETAQASGGSTALSGGLEAARNEAESWNEDAELYSITTVASSNVNARGESQGWLYSFVSESAGSVISIPYSGGQVRDSQGQELPEGQVGMLSEAVLSTGDLIDSPEAIQRSEEISRYLQENPEAEVSAGLDSTTSEEPMWILTAIGEGQQEQVPALE